MGATSGQPQKERLAHKLVDRCRPYTSVGSWGKFPALCTDHQGPFVILVSNPLKHGTVCFLACSHEQNGMSWAWRMTLGPFPLFFVRP